MTGSRFYPPIQNSPEAATTADITNTSTTIPVDYCEYFIPSGWTYTDVSDHNPVLAVLGPDNADYTYPETVKITGIDSASGVGNLTVTRGIGATTTIGTARSWSSGTKIASVLTAQHITQMQDALKNMGWTNGIGAEWDTSLNSPVLSRVNRFGATITTTTSDFDNSPVWGQMQRCNLADDGTVNAWYGDPDFAYDGSNGQVMVWVPAFYYISEKVDGDNGIRWAITPDPGTYLKRHPSAIVAGRYTPGFYAGAFHACAYDVSESTYITDDSSNVDFTAGTGDKLSSIAGVKPISGANNALTRANARILANNRGTGWQLLDFNQLSAIQLLFMIEQGTLNSQSVYEGVTDLASGTGNEAIYTGYTAGVGTESSDLGNSSGEVVITTDAATQPFSYRGIENFYGNIWTWIDGINIKANNNPWIADHGYEDDTFTAPYIDTGLTLASANGYVKAIKFDSENDCFFLASDINGSTSTYLCDYYYQTAGNRVARFGGHWHDGADAGVFGLDLTVAASHAYRDLSARLAFVP